MTNTDDRIADLASVIEEAVRRILAGTYVLEPGRVETYDPTTQMASIQPLLKRTPIATVRREVEGGPPVLDAAGNPILDPGTPELMPIIQGVPVWFPRIDARTDANPGGVQAHITFPVKPGTNVMCLFADKSLDKWKATGGEVDPQDVRSHALSDAVALPGLFPFNNPISNVDPSDIRIQLIWAERGIDSEFYLGGDTGDIVMRASGLIRAGSKDSIERVILGDLFMALYNGHTHTETGGTTSPPTVLMATTELSDKLHTEK